jgi:hypothetical protein
LPKQWLFLILTDFVDTQLHGKKIRKGKEFGHICCENTFSLAAASFSYPFSL